MVNVIVYHPIFKIRKGLISISFLDACSFTFNGVNSESYNLEICWIDDKPDVSVNGLKRNIESGTVNHVRLTTNNYGVTFEDNIGFIFYIIKKDNSNFSRQESMTINNWLTGSTTPKLLYFNDETIPSIHYYAVCTEIEDKVLNGHYGKKVVFKTNSPFGFMTQIERKFEVTDSDEFTIDNLADTITGIYYPTILLSSSSDENIIIENISDHKSVTLNLAKITPDSNGMKNININNRIMKILDKNNNDELVPLWKIGFETDYSSYVSSFNEYISKFYWFRLIQGTNKIKITGNCTITFVFEFPRKVGCL